MLKIFINQNKFFFLMLRIFSFPSYNRIFNYSVIFGLGERNGEEMGDRILQNSNTKFLQIVIGLSNKYRGMGV